ncbi:MAG: hypothetical protein N2595_07800 [bacterium]|nr:hypothetical protein [bacterium]
MPGIFTRIPTNAPTVKRTNTPRRARQRRQPRRLDDSSVTPAQQPWRWPSYETPAPSPASRRNVARARQGA